MGLNRSHVQEPIVFVKNLLLADVHQVFADVLSSGRLCIGH